MTLAVGSSSGRAQTQARSGAGHSGGTDVMDSRDSTCLRVLLVDDDSMLARLLETTIAAEGDMEVVGGAANADEALLVADELEADVAVVDVRLPEAEGLEAAVRLRSSSRSVRVVVLTARADPAVLSRAMAAAALDVIRSAVDDPAIVEPGLDAGAAHVVSGDLTPLGHARYGLTPRELEVLEALSTGHSPQQIARDLGISVHTCRGHVKRLLYKLDAHSQLEAVMVALNAGVLPTSH